MSDMIYIDTPMGSGDTLAPRKKPCPRCGIYRVPNNWVCCDSCAEDELRESCGITPKADTRGGATPSEVERVRKAMEEYEPPPRVVLDLGIDFSVPPSPSLPKVQNVKPPQKSAYLTESHRKKISQGLSLSHSKAMLGKIYGAFKVTKDLGVLPSGLRTVEAECTQCGEPRVRTISSLRKSKGCKSCGNKPNP